MAQDDLCNKNVKLVNDINETTSKLTTSNLNRQQQSKSQNAYICTNNRENFCIEKIFCYEMKNFLYVIGSSSCKTKHRILKIDRRKKYQLDIDSQDKVFTTQELMSYRRNEGFDPSTRGIEPTVAFGIAGFVRFLEGYYLILIVKRRCIALIGIHCIYKIEDTTMIYIPNEEKTINDEQRYLKIFNNVDLKSNFYFSYSYDLSNTLQYNFSPLCKCNIENFSFGFGTHQTIWDLNKEFRRNKDSIPFEDKFIYIKPNMKFVWNEYLLSPMHKAHNDFLLYICHGFVSQAMLPIDGRNLIITLIARRSKKYAGTRFLKRGANCEGFPANEVETEQIVHDGNISSFRYGLFSSYVQLRGSVPIYWSQTIAKMTPKPSINIDVNDPFYEAAGKHFNNLFYNYGSPIIVLNLVKRKEKRPQESILFNEFENSIEYLNQFLPKQYHIMLVGYDMAKSKKQDDNVISCLTNIAQYTMKKNGFFQNRLIALNQKLTENIGRFPQVDPNSGSFVQTGIVRVNCVDCLDRTNTAQCVIGMVALAYQLYYMGVLYKPELDPESDIVRLLEELYEDHGDTLALQYGGSQLVHRIKTYRKGAPITSQSKDIMQSLSRYYSNAFEDWDKQTAINLFLGIYQTNKNFPLIWNMNSDYELHHNFFGDDFDWHKISSRTLSSSQHRIRFTKWWSDQVALCLPRAAKEFFKYTKDGMSLRDLQFVKQIPSYDWFFDVHRLQENTIFIETFLFNMKKSKYYGDYKKKLSTCRVKNRQSLVGIPIIMRTVPNDSESSEESDGEQDKIIIRFENDLYAIQLDQVKDENNFDYNYNTNNKDTKIVKDKNYGNNFSPQHYYHQMMIETNENYMNKQLVNNRYKYERILRQLRQPIVKNHGHSSKSYATISNTLCYYDYLEYAKKFEHLCHENYYHMITRRYGLIIPTEETTMDDANQYPDNKSSNIMTNCYKNKYRFYCNDTLIRNYRSSKNLLVKQYRKYFEF